MHRVVHRCFVIIAGLLAVAFAGQAASAQKVFWSDVAPSNNTKVPILQRVGIDQKLNQQVPLDLTFRDETGRSVPLRSFFGQRPVILTLVYYQCPMLCTQVLNGLVSAMLPLKLDAGRDFEIVTVSFDPKETPQMAAAKKAVYVRRYGRPGAAQGWHFLTGNQANIKALTEAVGFRYEYDPKIKQFAHVSAITLLTPDGRVSRYYYGIEYEPRDLRLGMVESSKGQIGNVVDQVILYCYHYDPTTGKYGAVVVNMLRVGAILTMLILGSFMVIMFRRDAQAKQQKAKSAGRAA
jgi:protein SCO1/2